MPLSAKQAAALRRAPPKLRAKMQANFNSQAQRKPRPLPVGLQPQRTRAQLSLPAVPRMLRLPNRNSHAFALDGFDHRHLPTDESTAAYAVTNFVTPFEFSSSSTMDKILVIAGRHNATSELYIKTNLTDTIGVLYNAASAQSSLFALATARSPILGIPALTTSPQFTSIRGRIHNLSVRVECLGTDTGLFPPGSCYVGRVPSLDGGSTAGLSSKTLKETWAEDSISVGYLTSFSASSLMSRGCTIHSTVAENVSFKQWHDMAVQGSTTETGVLSISTALEPIVIYVPRAGSGDAVVNYRVNIAQQWCTRHPNNPTMRATQTVHEPSSAGVWNDVVSQLRSAGGAVLSDLAPSAVRSVGSRLIAAYGPAVAAA